MRSNLECLLQISGYQSWLAIQKTSPDKYSAGFFRNNQAGFLKTIQNRGRQSIMRLIGLGHCYVPNCQNALPASSELDHLIPISKGGQNIIENVFPLCPSHNSSKGKKDLVEWWMANDFGVGAFEHDALLHYSRMRYQQCLSNETLNDPAAEYLVGFVNELSKFLPSKSHQIAFLNITAPVKTRE